MDTVLLPAAETAALANLGTRGLRTAYGAAERAVAQAPTETGRREFLRKAGTLTAGTAAAAATPDIVKGAAKLLDAPSLREAPAVAARVAARAAPAEFYAAYRTAKQGGQAAYERAARPFNKAIKEADDEFAAELSRRPNTSNEDYYADLNFGSPKADDLRDEANKLGRDAQAKYEADALQKLRGDPRFAGFKTPDELEDLARADSMAGKNDLPTYWAEARKIGLLPDEEIESALKTGKSYTDPTTGNSAFLNKYGQMEWRSPEGNTARYQHWIRVPKTKSGGFDDIPF